MAFAFTDLAAGQGFQQDAITGGKASIPLSGTYTTTPTTIEARVIKASDNTVYQDWAACTGLVTASGAWSATLPDVYTYHPGPEGFRVDVRWKDGGGTVQDTVTGTAIWFVGESLVTAGSSTLLHACTTNMGPTTLTPSPYISNYSANATPNIWTVPVGAGAIAFLNRMVEVLQVPVFWVCAAISNTQLEQWSTAGTRNTALTTKVTASKVGTPRFTLIGLGGNNARIIPPNANYIPSAASVTTQLGQFAVIQRGKFGATHPIGTVGGQLSPTDDASAGATTTSPLTDPGWGYLCTGEYNASQTANGFYAAQNRTRAISPDNIHVDAPDDYQAMGVEMANSTLAYVYGQDINATFSNITAATYASATGVMDVTVDVPAGRKLTTATGVQTGVTGFQVSNDDRATFATISAAEVINRTTVRLTLPTGLTTPKVEYLHGHNPTPGANFLVTAQDDGTVTLANRTHLSAPAQAWINGTFLPAFSGIWTGTSSTTWNGTDQLATSAADLVTKVAALDLTKHHRIRLDTSGNWTTSQFSIRGRDFRANGGSLRIEPNVAPGPVINNTSTFQGVTNCEVVGVTFGQPVTINRQSTRPARPVMIFRNCSFGDYFNGNATTWYSIPDYFTASYADDLQLYDNAFHATENGPIFKSCRLVKMQGNDIQYTTGDTRDFHASTDPLADAEQTQVKYASDPWCYFWSRGNTSRNIIDQPVAGTPLEPTPPHSDNYQMGSTVDTLGMRCLFEFEAAYLERTNFNPGTGTQGGYKDDSPQAIQCVEHSSIIAICGISTTGAFGGGTAESFTYSERNTFVRTAGQDGTSTDNAPQAFAFRLVPPTVGNTNLYISNSIVGSVNVPAGGAFITQSNVVIANPKVSFLGGGSDYAARFQGTFTTDAFGRSTYSFDDAGTNSQTAFRSALWAQFQPKAAYTSSAAPNPADWPV